MDWRYWNTGELISPASISSERLRHTISPASHTAAAATIKPRANSAMRATTVVVNTPRKSIAPNHLQSV